MFPEMAILFVYLHRVVADHRSGVVDVKLLNIFTDLSININDSHRGLNIFQRPVNNRMKVVLATTFPKRMTVLAR